MSEQPRPVAEAPALQPGDIDVWRRVERAINAEAERICRSTGCDCKLCGAARDKEWRRLALNSIRTRQALRPPEPPPVLSREVTLMSGLSAAAGFMLGAADGLDLRIVDPELPMRVRDALRAEAARAQETVKAWISAAGIDDSPNEKEEPT